MEHNVSFTGFKWNSTIGTTGVEIYKIALQTMSIDKDNINYMFNHTLDYLISQMGKYSKHRFLSRKYVWHTSDGKVWFDNVNKIGQHSIILWLLPT